MVVQNGITVEPQLGECMRLSPDGYVRLTQEEFWATPLIHLISGLDIDERPLNNEETSHTHISGYTEWVSQTVPVITLGWDWRVEGAPGQIHYLRTELPRSNVMLVDVQRRDLGLHKTIQLLGAIIDEMVWGIEVQRQITDKYN